MKIVNESTAISHFFAIEMKVRMILLITLISFFCMGSRTALAEGETGEVIHSLDLAEVLDADWVPVRDFPLPEGGNLAETCTGRAVIWKNEKTANLLYVGWIYCRNERDQETIREQLREYYSYFAQFRPEIRERSVLPGGADVVLDGFRQGEGVSRLWLEEGIFIELTAVCYEAESEECSDLTAAVAVPVSELLPGEPEVPEERLPEGFVSEMLRSAAGLFSSLILGLLLIVAGVRLHEARKLDSFCLSSNHPRVISVDFLAAKLRVRALWPTFGDPVLFLGLVALVLPASSLFIGMGVNYEFFIALIPGLLLVLLGVTLTRIGWRTEFRASPIIRAPISFSLRRLGAWLLLSIIPIAELWAIIYLATVALSQVIVAPVVEETENTAPFLLAVLLGMVLCVFALSRLARALRSLGADQSMEVDPRPAFLYLRNFKEDSLKIPANWLTRQTLRERLTSWLNPIPRSRFEELLASRLWSRGPLVALGHPDHKLPKLGAARNRVVDKESPGGDRNQAWQEEVRRLAGMKFGEKGCWAFVVSSTPQKKTDAFAWELELLATRAPHQRIILVVGPHQRAAYHEHWSRFLAMSARYPLFRPLAGGWVGEGTLVLVHVPSEGTGSWYAFEASKRDSWSYTAALAQALEFSERRWREPDSPRNLPPANGGWGSALAPLDPGWVNETVYLALRQAVMDAGDQPVTTWHLLSALIRSDTEVDWSRVELLLTQDPYRSTTEPGHDTDFVPLRRAHGGYLNGSAYRAVQAAFHLSHIHLDRSRGGFTPLSTGMLTLALVADIRSAAARALGADTPGKLASVIELVQQDVLGFGLPALDLSHAGGFTKAQLVWYRERLSEYHE